jgi:LacI family transcriptional regulator
MKTTKIAVLGATNFAHANALLSGVNQYARDKPDWEIIPLHYSQEKALGQLVTEGRIDGLIGAMLSDGWVAALRGDVPIPILNTSSLSELTSTSSVIPDDVAIGALAADHFARRRYGMLLFAGVRSYACSAVRRRGFSARAAENGIKVLELPHANITSSLDQWRDIIEKTPKPVGLFCVDDHTARRIISVCRHADIAIPEDVAIIGVGNSQLDSFFAGIGISSVDIPLSTIGYTAAASLDQQLGGSRGPSECIKIAPRGLTLRETTGTGALNTLVGRAINYIETNLASPMTVLDLAKHTHASRRLIELRFRESLGRSPHEEITHLRMAKARQLLHDPHLAIAGIASQCGYPEVSHFYARFKQHHKGVPPGAWRKALAGRKMPGPDNPLR